MDSVLFLVLGLIAGVIAGIAIGWGLRARKSLPSDAGDLAVRVATAEARVAGKEEQIETLERIEVLADYPRMIERGVTALAERVYRLTRR